MVTNINENYISAIKKLWWLASGALLNQVSESSVLSHAWDMLAKNFDLFSLVTRDKYEWGKREDKIKLLFCVGKMTKEMTKP